MIKKIFFVFVICILLGGCSAEKEENVQINTVGSMELMYAKQFSVDYFDDGCAVIHIADDDFLLVPEDTEIPQNVVNMTILKQPISPIYLAASSAMDLFDAIGELDNIKMTSTDIDDWSLQNVKDAVSEGKIKYIGKYNSPDYEILAESECKIAIESTMIYHSPEVKEEIELLGIPVMVERSSYEEHPLGRMEWIKLYGLLLGKEETAENYFKEKTAVFEKIDNSTDESERKTAAFFYLSSNGYVNIRKPGDYVSNMISLAGGKYIFTADQLNVEENALSTMNIQLEEFYAVAKDADVLIYNSTIEGEIDTIGQLIEKNEIFADFKAVKTGDVWCSEKNMFQQTTGAADMISDLNMIFTGEAEDKEQLTYMHRLRR
ncbi:MAG: ABC transporter substrate-binding protein [Firmicutes bacterium]|nr:ABC transporter substrate-binding protein [Bacillota bacterium]